MAEQFTIVWTIHGETISAPLRPRMLPCSKPKSSCANMGVISKSAYTYLRRLLFGSPKNGCEIGVLLDSRPSESRTESIASALEVLSRSSSLLSDALVVLANLLPQGVVWHQRLDNRRSS